MKIMIACGGTGGHLFPGVAVAQELRSRGHEVKLLISQKKVDAQASAKYKQLDFEVIPAVAKPSTFSLKMIPFLWKMWRAIRVCKKLHKHGGTDAVIGMGGFTSLAPVLAGHQMGAKAYVHDSNVLPGKANRLTARWCDKVMLGFKEASGYFAEEKVEITGTPVREEMEDFSKKREEAHLFAETLGFSLEQKTVLVMGGSQGAKKLNDYVVQLAKAMPGVQFLHITGNADYERIKHAVGTSKNHKLLAFCDDMVMAYAVSDLALMRSGASSLTELAYVGLASILVPYPYAADDHQTRNAEVFEHAGAALLRQESEIDAGSLVADVSSILDDEQKLENMSLATKSLAVVDAAEQIATVVEARK